VIGKSKDAILAVSRKSSVIRFEPVSLLFVTQPVRVAAKTTIARNFLTDFI
jgi:hypothetical protein